MLSSTHLAQAHAHTHTSRHASEADSCGIQGRTDLETVSDRHSCYGYRVPAQIPYQLIHWIGIVGRMQATDESQPWTNPEGSKLADVLKISTSIRKKPDMRYSGKLSRRKVPRKRARRSASKVEGGACPTFFW